MQHEAIFNFHVPADRSPTGREEVLCSFNQRAMITVNTLTGIEPIVFLLDPEPTLRKIAILTYACTESFRRGNGITLSFDEFIEGPYLGQYLSQYWIDLCNFIEKLIQETFPDVVSIRKRAHEATKTKAGESPESPQEENRSTGSSDSSSPGNSE
jgi:hypothetical protein